MTTYDGFDIYHRINSKITPLPSVTIERRDVSLEPEGGAITLLTDTASDASGHIASASVDLPAGSTVRFTWKDETTGKCGFVDKVTS